MLGDKHVRHRKPPAPQPQSKLPSLVAARSRGSVLQILAFRQPIYIYYIYTYMCIERGYRYRYVICIYGCLSVYMSVCPSICMSICQSVCVCFCLSACLYACVYVCVHHIRTPLHTIQNLYNRLYIYIGKTASAFTCSRC